MSRPFFNPVCSKQTWVTLLASCATQNVSFQKGGQPCRGCLLPFPRSADPSTLRLVRRGRPAGECHPGLEAPVRGGPRAADDCQHPLKIARIFSLSNPVGRSRPADHPQAILAPSKDPMVNVFSLSGPAAKLRSRGLSCGSTPSLPDGLRIPGDVLDWRARAAALAEPRVRGAEIWTIRETA